MNGDPIYCRKTFWAGPCVDGCVCHETLTREEAETLSAAIRPFRLMIETFEPSESGGMFGGAGLDRLSAGEWLNIRENVTEAIRGVRKAYR